jgi:hypothetical protein
LQGLEPVHELSVCDVLGVIADLSNALIEISLGHNFDVLRVKGMHYAF